MSLFFFIIILCFFGFCFDQRKVKIRKRNVQEMTMVQSASLFRLWLKTLDEETLFHAEERCFIFKSFSFGILVI